MIVFYFYYFCRFYLSGYLFFFRCFRFFCFLSYFFVCCPPSHSLWNNEIAWHPAFSFCVLLLFVLDCYGCSLRSLFLRHSKARPYWLLSLWPCGYFESIFVLVLSLAIMVICSKADHRVFRLSLECDFPSPVIEASAFLFTTTCCCRYPLRVWLFKWPKQ